MYLSLYCKGSKRVTQGFTVRGSWWPNRTAIYWPPLLWPSAMCFLVLQGCSTGGPEAHSAGCELSLPYLVTNGSPNTFGRGFLSLPHLINNFSGPQLNLVSNVSYSNSDFLSWLSYIIVQRPLNNPLNLWNGMFDRHQAEITVMQFRGHSLPVHQSLSVSWDFLPCPISSTNFRLRDFFRLLAIGCVTSFRCITLEWHIWSGRRSKYNRYPSRLTKRDDR